MLGYITEKKIPLAILIFFAVISQGAYFAVPLIIINIFFICAIILRLRKNDIAVDANAIFFVAFFIIMCVSFAFSFSVGDGITELLRYLLFPLSYIYFYNQKNPKNISDIFYKAFIILMAFGLMGIFGLSFLDGMLNAGGRLQSFFQYANTTALAMGIGIFYSTEKFRSSKKKQYLLFAALFFLAMILTQSRVSFVFFGLVYLFYIFKFVSIKIKLLSLAGLVVLWIILALLDSRIVNISVFTPTLVERYISYFDALGMLLQNPMGVGLANWRFLQFYHQSAPYQVQYIHNFYLQIALDGGILAVAVMLIAIASSFIKSSKIQCVHFYIGIFILLSAIFEVHFAFGVIIIYFTFLLAEIGGGRIIRAFRLRYAKYALILPVIPLLMLLISSIYINTGASLEHANQRQAAYRAYSTAHRLNPFDNNLYFSRARVAASPEEAFDRLNSAHTANPWDSNVIFALAEGHLRIQEPYAAFDFGSRLMEIHPLNMRNQQLMRSIIIAIDSPSLSEEFEAQILEINSNINPLYRHIDSQMRY